ncbi:MAG: alpha/beta hydrolase, partial [Pseudomonadota bacterium]|nr:alpha/beta hydrolase [Pseudomonadota bacterium]
STGQHDDGIGEIEDLRAVVEWASRQTRATELILAGFSFGAYIAAAGADRVADWQIAPLHLGRLVLVAPAVENYPMSNLMLPDDTLVIVGDQDEVVDPQAMMAWAKDQELRLAVLSGATHFFHGRLSELSAQL